MLSSPIIKIIHYNLKNSGNSQLIWFTSDGYVRGYDINFS